MSFKGIALTRKSAKLPLLLHLVIAVKWIFHRALFVKTLKSTSVRMVKW